MNMEEFLKLIGGEGDLSEDQKVLRGPFNIETHKKQFVNYLEVIISEDGTVMYAVPSHQEKLIKMACEKLNVEREEIHDLCPDEYKWDYMVWLCEVSGCVALWNVCMQGRANELQQKTIETLKEEGLYRGDILV
ncbi:hypothetical protein [Bacillus toyonensis]|uniref:hypothetical protein n=1 Tax=Bacillus toyonensis TaxID=155322 RepID=UPI002E247451|nr:hypothetical protein [Bacillus toyonensis]